MTDYQITLPDGTTFKGVTAYETLGMALAYQNKQGAEAAQVAENTVNNLTSQR